MEVVFFPRNDYPNNIEICTHRLGKKMTFTEQTDVQNVSYNSINTFSAFVEKAKAKSIKVGCFMDLSSPVRDYNNYIIDNYANGKLWLDAYSYTNELEQKIAHGGIITEQEWSDAYNNIILPNFRNFTGKKPVALSYSYGNDSFKDYVIPKFLGARNSEPSGNTIHNTFPSDYGLGYGTPNNEPYSINRYKSKASSMRWYDAAKEQGNNFETQLQIVSQKIDETMLNGGWLNNFTHWHNYWQNGEEQWVEPYLSLLAQKNANNEIYFAGYGEAVAYLVYRESISRVVMYSPVGAENNKLVIRLEAKNIFNIDTDLLQIPISIKFSTANTPLENQDVRCVYNLISLGNNQYIVEIPYNEYACAVIERVTS